MAQLKIPLDSARFATGFTWKDYIAQMGDGTYVTTQLTQTTRQIALDADGGVSIESACAAVPGSQTTGLR